MRRVKSSVENKEILNCLVPKALGIGTFGSSQKYKG